MADLGNLSFSVHLQDMTDADAEKIKRKLENLSVNLNIDGNNIKVSNVDIIKKQIEDAVKSVDVFSVKVNADAVKQQIEGATQNLVPQVKVTLLKDDLSTDIQSYLDKKVFKVKIAISKSESNKAIKELGLVTVPCTLKVSKKAALADLKESLKTLSVPVGVRMKSSTELLADIKDKLKDKSVKVGIDANKTVLRSNVAGALKDMTFKAKLDLVIQKASVQDAIRQAFEQAGLKYNTTLSDVRQNLIDTRSAKADAYVRAQQALADYRRAQIGSTKAASTAAQSQRNLGNAYNYAAKGAYSSARASVQLGQTLRTNIRLAGELGTTIGNLASVFGLKDLLQNVIRIGGQLENQRIALGAILQDGGKAIEMFSRIQTLAVKSPFGIMDLNQYTKQLSAYSVPYNELYDTMKRLADISAGVGVDMGRIILAFGQVKAAGFLKGTELRQFTEANIPMVDKLAERFTHLTGTIVDAGKVYDMISKKQVTFEDVKSVLWDLTDEGGMFNNMQEVLSESLASKWKNLADAVDVMFGKIADGSVGGGLKAMAEGLTELTKNWEYLVSSINSAITAYTLYKIAVAASTGSQANGVLNTIAANHRLEKSNLRLAQTYRQLSAAERGSLAAKTKFTTAELRQAAVSKMLTKEMALRLVATKNITVAQAGHLKKILDITRAEIAHAAAVSRTAMAWGVLRNAFAGLWTAMKGLFLSPWTWVFAGITAITEYFAYAKKKEEELNEMTKEVSESAKGSMETIGKELDRLKGIKLGELDDTAIKVQIEKLTTLIKNEAPYWQGILSEVFEQKADGTFVKTAREQLDLLIEKMKDVQDARQMLADNPEAFADAVDATDSGWGDDSVIESFQKYGEAVKKSEKLLSELGSSYSRVKEAIDAAASSNEDFQKESAGKSIQQQVILLRKYEDAFKDFRESLEDIDPKALEVIDRYVQGLGVINVNQGSTFFKDVGTFQESMWEPLLSKGYTKDAMLDEQARQFVMSFGNKLIEKAQIQDPALIKEFWENFLKGFGLDYIPDFVVPKDAFPKATTEYDASKDEVAKLWKKRAEEIAKAVSAYDKWKEVEGQDKARNRITGMDEFENLFNGKYGFALNLEDPTEAYRYIQGKLNKNLSAQNDLIVQLGIKLSDAELKDAKDKLKAYLDETKKFIDKTTSQWDLYKKLFEATGNRALSQEIAFGGQISFKDQLEQLRSEIEKQMNTLGVSKKFEELIGMDKESLEQGGFASLANLIEAYNKENKKLTDESVKNFIEILNASKDFEQQIADIERKLQKDLADLTANSGKMQEGELERRRAELIANAEEKKTKVRFEEFKKSSDWVKVFDDLDRVSNDTLDMMIRKIEEFAKQAHLSEEVTKQLVNAMAKLRDEAIERNPFQGFVDAWKRLKELNSGVLTESGMVRFGSGTANDPYTYKTNKQVSDEKSEANADLNDSALAVANKFKAVADASDMLTGLFENMGISMDGFLGAISSVLGGAASGAQTGAGIASALGAAGPWGAVAGAAVGMLSSVFAMHDKALQKEIEASQAREKLIQSISDNLENALNSKIGGIFTMTLDEVSRKQMETLINLTEVERKGRKKKEVNVYSEGTRDMAESALRDDSYYKAQEALLMAELDEVKKQKEDEEDKKNADEQKIADYELAIAELEGELEMFAQNMMDTLYGIDFKDWASQFTDSIVNAWASGEDAAEAYKNTVSEVMRNVAASVIQQGIIGKWLEENMSEVLELFSKTDGIITDEVYSAMADLATGVGAKVEETETFLEAWEKILNEKGYSMKDLESSSSGLSKGIQSVTEDTADLLASYVNAIRADVSVKRSLIEKLIAEDIPNMSYLAEAQLRELSQIQANTAKNVALVGEIRDLVNRVVDKGSNKLKV